MDPDLYFLSLDPWEEQKQNLEKKKKKKIMNSGNIDDKIEIRIHIFPETDPQPCWPERIQGSRGSWLTLLTVFCAFSRKV